MIREEYRLRVITKRGELRNGMYSCGVSAATVELAVSLPGTIHFDPSCGERLAVCCRRKLSGQWIDAAGYGHERWSSDVVVDIIELDCDRRNPGICR